MCIRDRGGSIYERMQNEGRFPEKQAKFYAQQIAVALGELHKIKIVHRDLKAENVCIDANGYIKLIDFGLASTKLERLRSFVGTREYMAPELLEQREYGFAVDWWALGVLAFEMVYGETPFCGRNINELN